MISLVFLAIISQAKPVDKAQPQSYQLRYFEGEFILRQGRSAWRTRVPAALDAPLTSVAYRKDDKWVVWDERGLTIRVGDRVTSTKLDGIARSPRIFPKKELTDSLELMRRGERSPFAGGLAGSRRVASEIFFVPRWLDKQGLTWLEALVKVDLAKDNPKPELVLRIPGVTIQNQVLDRWLTADDLGLRLPVRRKGEWALLTINGETVDESVQDAELSTIDNDRYIEILKTGLSQYGTIDWKTSELIPIQESRAKMAFVSSNSDLLQLSQPDQTSLLYLPKGTIWEVGKSSVIDKIGPYTLSYQPNLTTASVYITATGKLLATWKAASKK